MHIRLGLFTLVLLLCVGTPRPLARAAEDPPPDHAASAPAAPAAHDATEGQRSVTHHRITIDGQPLDYTATADFIPLKDATGRVTARLFYVAYTRDAAPTTAPASAATEPASAPASAPATAPAPHATRPIMFIFNGGPGAASAWLHLGTAGPYRLAVPAQAVIPAPPYTLVPNPATWLTAADLVFIDPVGTGYSRATQPEKAQEFYNTRHDIESVGEFIRLFLTQYDRWDSPKFLAGESYGTTRAAALSNYLLDAKGISLNGVILISTVLNFQTLSPSEGNDLPYWLALPSYTAAAWYHHRLAPDLQKDLPSTLREAETFAGTTYLAALAQGSALDDAQRTQVADQLARLTGIPQKTILAGNLRIDPARFMQDLLRDQRQLIGRMDTRLTAYESDPLASRPDFDPAIAGYIPAYTATFVRYVRDQLKFESAQQYELLKGLQWDFGNNGNFGGGGYLYVGDDLRDAIVKNPHLHVLVASGYFDLATPFFATDYTVAHLNLPPELRGNITQTYYPGGHMMYHEPGSLQKLHDDIARFVQQSLAGKGEAK